MNAYSFLNVVALIAIFISILLIFFLLTVKSKNGLANILLAGFILFCAVDISGVILGQHLKDKPESYAFIKSLTFLIFPLLYYYVLSICYSNFKLKFKYLFHALPFVLYNLLLASTFLFVKCESLVFSLHKFSTYLIKLQALFYLIAIIYVLRNYKKVYLENFANGNIGIYKWLSHIVLLFLITLPVTIIKDFSSFYKHQEIFTWTISILNVSALAMFSWFILKALLAPEIFRGIDTEMKPTSKLTNSKNKSLEIDADSKSLAIIEQIKKHMLEQEPFLESSLTLQDLASQINIPARELSIIINQHIGQHFFDFINHYRIEKAIEMLENFSSKEFTIQQILFDVGFNSKSSFNTAFKKYTGLTPSEYRKIHSKNDLNS